MNIDAAEKALHEFNLTWEGGEPPEPPEPRPTMQPFTVLLLYPDYMPNQYDGQETYLAHVEAVTVDEAVEVAQREAFSAQEDMTDECPSDFAVLFVCPGHQIDLAAELHG